MTTGMQILDATLPTLAENLALDEALLQGAEAGGPEILRLWSWPRHAVVLGAAGRIVEDVHEDACLRDAVPVARRSSGGGTVLLGPGCLLFSLVLPFDGVPKLADLRASYRHILGRVQHALLPIASTMEIAGTSDLTCNGRKFSGNAQQRKRTHFLHHGTILFDFDLSIIETYLKSPPRQPEYRQRRDHAEFLCNVPATEAQLKRLLGDAFNVIEPCGDIPRTLVDQLVQEKYARAEWTRQR